MAVEQSPAFQFYPKDLLSDPKFLAMSTEARGVYWVLLMHCWLEVTIPDDARILRAISLYTGRNWIRIWKQVAPCFTYVEGGLQNKRIESERAKQYSYRTLRSAAGRAGGLASVKARKSLSQRPLNSVDLDVAAKSTSSSSSSSSSSIDPTDIQVISNSLAPVKRTNGERAHGRTEPEIGKRSLPQVLDGSLPREHLSHALCDKTFSRCVPAAVHAKFVNQLAPKHAGDRTATADALKAWYPTVWATLSADAVVGDAFKFWQPHFDGAFVTAVAPRANGNGTVFEDPETMAAGVRELLKKQGFYDDRK